MGSSLINNKASFWNHDAIVIFRISFIIALGSFLFSCNPDRNETYKVSGVLYDEDGITPVANHKLSVALTNFGSGAALTNSEYLDYPTEGYTDENGAFELEYQHDKKAQHMMVFSESAGRLITSAANQDHDRDLCLDNISFINIKFVNSSSLLETDTVFFISTALDRAITEYKMTAPADNYDSTINVITYPFDELNDFNNLKEDWNREGTSNTAVFWKVNNVRKSFDRAGNVNGIDIADFNFKGSIPIQGFPYTTEVEVDLAK